MLRIRAWPLELVNGAPLDAATTAHHVHDLRTQVAPELFAGFDAGHFPTTSLPALAVAHAAFSRSPGVGEAVSFALRDALFEENLDISRPDVLADVARRHGVDPATTLDKRSITDDWDEGRQRGVKGSPHFFCGGLDVFCPTLDIARSGTGRLEVNPNLAALDAFLGGCFGS